MGTTEAVLRLDSMFLAFMKKVQQLTSREFLYHQIVGFFNSQGVAGELMAVVTKQFTVSGVRTRTGQGRESILARGELYSGYPAVRVGALRGPAVKYMGIQEFGTRGKNPDSPYDTIRPRNAKALAIPENKALTPAGVPRWASPKDYPGKLHFIPFRRGLAVGALYDDKEVAKIDRAVARHQLPDFRDFKALWLLVRQVDVAPHYFMRDGFNAFLPTLVKRLGDFLQALLFSVSLKPGAVGGGAR